MLLQTLTDFRFKTGWESGDFTLRNDSHLRHLLLVPECGQYLIAIFRRKHKEVTRASSVLKNSIILSLAGKSSTTQIVAILRLLQSGDSSRQTGVLKPHDPCIHT